MAGFNDFSTTAASNASIGAINFAEGQLPSTVNNSNREVLKDIADVREGNVVATGWHVDANGLTLHDQSDSTKKIIFDVSGVSAGSTRTIGFQNTAGTVAFLSDVASSINSKGAETIPATGDLIPFHSASAGAERKITLSNMLKVINSLTEDTSPDTAADFLLSYDTSASGVKKVKPSSLVTVQSVARFSHTQASGANGGSSVASTWTICPVTGEVSDPDGIASVSSNQITIAAAGTYEIQAWQTLRATNAWIGALRVRDVTNSATLARGPETGGSDAGIDTAVAVITPTEFTLAASAVLEVQYWMTQATSSNGLGTALSTGEAEVYGAVIIKKISD